mgnify:CR=1 FL=1
MPRKPLDRRRAERNSRNESIKIIGIMSVMAAAFLCIMQLQISAFLFCNFM